MSIALFAFAGLTVVCFTILVLRLMRHRRELEEKKMDHKAKQDKRYDQMVLDDSDVPAVESGPSKDEIRDVVRDEVQTASQSFQDVQRHTVEHRMLPGHIKVNDRLGTVFPQPQYPAIREMTKHPEITQLSDNRVRMCVPGFTGIGYVMSMETDFTPRGIALKADMDILDGRHGRSSATHELRTEDGRFRIEVEVGGSVMSYKQIPMEEPTQLEKEKAMH